MAVAGINRRDILAALCGACALGLCVRTNAQTTTSVRRIGSLGLGADLTPAEVQKIWGPAREFGWIEGKNLIVERRRTLKPELLQSYAEELVRLKVELILTIGTAATIAARNATTRIPIVMYSAGDPVASGLVTSLSKPGGNVTGYSLLSSVLYVKGLSLLHETLPSVQRVGLMIYRDNPYSRILREESEKAFRTLGLQLIVVEVASPGEIDNAVAVAAREGAQALYVSLDTGVVMANRVMRSANKHALPVIAADRSYSEAGGLASLAPDEAEPDTAMAYFIDKILRGANPADLPIQQPTRFVLSINLKTAKALGLTIPRAVLERADEVIQ